jgi:small subunit ribosomal protein S20
MSILRVELHFGIVKVYRRTKLANIKSAIKRNKQNEKKRVANRIYRGEARTFIAKARKAVAGGVAEEAKTATIVAVSALDKAVTKGVIHKNNAARRKSRLMKHLNALAK